MDSLPKNRNWVGIILVLIALWIFSAILANFVTVFTAEPQVSGNVAIIPVHGAITVSGGDSFASRGASSEAIVKMIDKAAKDSKIKGIIIDINSPGGSAVASEEIANSIKRANKTTVAWIREVGASGAYWVASSAEHVVASRGSTTGSIGVIASYLEFSDLLEKFNITYERLVSGEYKDLGSQYKDLTSEEREILMNKLDSLHNYFMAVVADNRNLTMDEVRGFASGEFFLGQEAASKGLIDALGGKKEAISYIEKKHNITAKPVKYSQRVTFIDLLSGLITEHGYSVGQGLGESMDQGMSVRT